MKEIMNNVRNGYIFITMLFLLNFANLNAQQVEVIGDFKAPLIWADGTIQTNTIVNDGFEDMTLSPFTTSGDSDWTVINFDGYAGTYSAVSGYTLPNETSSIHLTVVVPEFHTANLSFATKSSAFPGVNSFYVNNSFEFSVTSTDVWTIFEKELPSGTYNLEWRLEVFGLFPLNEQLRLDAVSVTYLGDHVVRIQDGNQALGKILTSDQYGNATWENHPTLIQPNAADNVGLKILYPDDPSDPACIFNGSMALGDGVFVMNALTNGFESRCSGGSNYRSLDAGGHGYSSYNPSTHGFYSSDAGISGFYSESSGNNGYHSEGADNHGFFADQSGSNGFRSEDSMFDGFYSANAGTNGFYSSYSTGIGFYSLNAGDQGFYSFGPEHNGFHSVIAGVDGFYADSPTNNGFFAVSAGNVGFYSNNSATDGFSSYSDLDDGFSVIGAGDDGIYSNNCTGDEGYFSGTVVVTGNLSKGGGSFKIDHPLDPENKFLYHSFVESPDMMNVYNGNIVTDGQGLATVEMEDWFDTLNRDFRYQLTVIGVFAQAIIKKKIANNQFVIQTDLPNIEVSWQITGIRQDPYANKNRIEVEVDKSAEFKGQYLHPEAYNQPFEKGFDYIKLGRKTLEELEAEHTEKVEKK